MNKFINFITIFISIIAAQACTKQNEPTPIKAQPHLQRSGDYFANLRAYKKSHHQIYFGWFGGTGVPGSADFPGVLDGIPDSVDIVSLWGGVPPLGTYNHQLLQKTRELKGTRFVNCMFGSGVEGLMKKNDSALFVNDVMAAIDKVAKAISDTINKYQIDGFDLDYEPGFGDRSIFGDSGGSATNDVHTQRLFKALSQYLGPKSGTGKLLIIDGQGDVGIGEYIDYFMQQAYGASTGSNLQNRLQTFGGGRIPAEKFVPCENFEDYWRTGGVNFTDPLRGTIPSLFGFAHWQPTGTRKGGIGTYHTEYEYPLTPDYYYTRRAIQIMNPAAK
jgi:hypothetical protein